MWPLSCWLMFVVLAQFSMQQEIFNHRAMIQNGISRLGPPHPIPVETRDIGGNSANRFHASSAGSFHYAFSRTNDDTMVDMMSDRAHTMSATCQRVVTSMNFRRADDVRRYLDSPEMKTMMRSELSPYCYEVPQCIPTSRFRETSGVCNNLRNPLLGKAFTSFSRMVPSAYDDGIEAPRTRSVLGPPLPSARQVSNIVHRETGLSVDKVLTNYLPIFGQFMDHDMTSTPLMEDENDNMIEDCCINPERFECFIIRVPLLDPFFKDPARKCMHFVRSDAAPSLDCSSGIRQQQNQRSSFIDGTTIYGFNKAKEDSLRTGRYGLLMVSTVFPGTPGLLKEAEVDTCNIRPEDRLSGDPQHCFEAGDNRHTENPLLVVIHTAFLRRHNLIATYLRRFLQTDNDELIFQETKRIVLGELQHITYAEFLPVVLNRKIMSKFNLNPVPDGYTTGYSDKIDPRIMNGFSTAAYRFGHSLISQRVGKDNGKTVFVDFLDRHFDRPRLILSEKGTGQEAVTNWKSRTASSRPDGFITDSLRDRLFITETSEIPRATLSFDLAALNIQRGRDHGLPGYNVYRKWCGFQPARHFGTWAMGLTDHDPRQARKLKSVYRHPDDIDLFAGGLSENRLHGALVGPTFACIIANQFQRLKQGDRFFYENDNPFTRFTLSQLAQIKRVTLAKILCSTSTPELVPVLQPKVFFRSSTRNPPTSCETILGGGELGFDIAPFVQEIVKKHSMVPRVSAILPLNPTMIRLQSNPPIVAEKVVYLPML